MKNMQSLVSAALTFEMLLIPDPPLALGLDKDKASQLYAYMHPTLL